MDQKGNPRRRDVRTRKSLRYSATHVRLFEKLWMSTTEEMLALLIRRRDGVVYILSEINVQRHQKSTTDIRKSDGETAPQKF